MQFCGGYQYLQYTYDLIMYPEVGLVENLMPQMISKIYQMLKLSNGDTATPTLTEAMTGPYKAEVITDMTQDIKEPGQHGTWTIVNRTSVTGTHILPSTLDFKVK